MDNAEKITSINSLGWDGVNSVAAPFTCKNQTQQREVDIAFSKAFQSPDGQKVLEYFREKYLNQPCWTPGADPSYGYAREGQNSLIREIEKRIQRAHEPTE